MSELVDHLAELTGFRDRDVLDVTLAGAFRDLLHPRSVAIYRMVGDGDKQHWLTRARLVEGDAVATADPAWVDLEQLPKLADHPARCQALTGQTVCTSVGGAGFSVFPLATDREVVGVLELETEEPLNTDAQVYGCGSTHMADGVRTGLADLHRGRTRGATDRRGLAAPTKHRRRYLVDVWASG